MTRQKSYSKKGFGPFPMIESLKMKEYFLKPHL